MAIPSPAGQKPKKKNPAPVTKAKRNAYLLYRDNKNKSHIHHIWVMGYDQPFELAGNEEQSKLYQHFYPDSYAPGNMTVEGRVAYQRDYNELAEFIRAHHIVLMNSPGNSNNKGDFISLMELSIPHEGLQVAGIIIGFQAGAKRFNVAPSYTFDLMVIKNRQSLQVNSSYTVRAAWDGSLVGSAPTNAQSKNKAKTVGPPPTNITNKPPQIVGFGPR